MIENHNIIYEIFFEEFLFFLRMKIQIILILLIVDHSFLIKPSEFCLKKNNQKCHLSNFKHKCNNFCTKSVKICKSFEKFSLSARKIVNPLMDNLKISKYNSFIKSIDSCKKKVYKWNSNDLCVNKNKSSLLRNNNISIQKTKICNGKSGFTNCGPNFCAKTQEACDYFKKHISKHLLSKLNFC